MLKLDSQYFAEYDKKIMLIYLSTQPVMCLDFKLPETKFKFYFDPQNCKNIRKKAFEVQNAVKTCEYNLI